jgi:cytochrome c oxidase cbb3-type subunit 4
VYEKLAQFAQTWGLFYVVVLFAVALVYALWPKNQATFDRAARAPLADDDSNDGADL